MFLVRLDQQNSNPRKIARNVLKNLYDYTYSVGVNNRKNVGSVTTTYDVTDTAVSLACIVVAFGCLNKGAVVAKRQARLLKTPQ